MSKLFPEIIRMRHYNLGTLRLRQSLCWRRSCAANASPNIPTSRQWQGQFSSFRGILQEAGFSCARLPLLRVATFTRSRKQASLILTAASLPSAVVLKPLVCICFRKVESKEVGNVFAASLYLCDDIKTLRSAATSSSVTFPPTGLRHLGFRTHCLRTDRMVSVLFPGRSSL